MWTVVDTWLALRLVAQATDPSMLNLPALGVTGVCLVIMGYQLKREIESSKQKDALIAAQHADKESWIVAQTRANDLILQATSALSASAQALDKVAESLSRVPGEDTFVRLRVALERIEETGRLGGRNDPPAAR